MTTAKTFATHLIEQILPSGMAITRPIDNGYLDELLQDVAARHPADYARVVVELKNLGDKLSTWEAKTIGLDEIDVPDRKKRDALVLKYNTLIKTEKDPVKVNAHLADFQNDLADVNLNDSLQDGMSIMLRSAMGGKKTQAMKLRTSPGVVGDHTGKIVPEIFDKSYAEGVDVLPFWLGAVESRHNLAQGQVSTSAPGELSKIISNLMTTSVVSAEDCGTKRGIELLTRDDDVIGRLLVGSAGGYSIGTRVTPDVQQGLLKKNVVRLLVRSPETCQAVDSTICSACMGVRPGTGKPYTIGDNVGMIIAGSLGEPLTQMTLSAKHSTSMAGEKAGLRGEKGFRTIAEAPSLYPDKMVLSEMYGRVTSIEKAPQGGQILTVEKTGDVPERFIVNAKRARGANLWAYYVSPKISILPGVATGTEVHPGMELTDGNKAVRDVARLQGLGAARSSAAQSFYDVYKNSGFTQSRAGFELLARNAHPYVKVEKAPSGFGIHRGETVTYNRLEDAMAKASGKPKAVADAIGQTLSEGVLDITAGTIITPQIAQRLMAAGIQKVKATSRVEVSPVTLPLSRVLQQSEDWIGAMNHRNLAQQIKDAASFGKHSDIAGYNPISSFSYGLEMTQDEHGKY